MKIPGFGGFRGGGQIERTTHAELNNEDGDEQNLGNDETGDNGDEDGEESLGVLAKLFGTDDEDDGDDAGSGKKRKKKHESIDDDDDESADDDDDEEESAGGGKKKKGSLESQLAAEIQTMIAGMTIAEDDIPEGFDPNDPKQLRSVLGKIQQKTAVATMQMTFKPMEAAIRRLSDELRGEIRNSISNSQGSQQARQILETIVPEAKKEELTGLVDNLFTQASKKEKNPTKAAQLVRKALDAMNLGDRGSGRQRDSDPSGAAFKSGKDALDLFAPLPQQRAKKKA